MATIEVARTADPKEEPAKVISTWTKMLSEVRPNKAAALRMPDLIKPPSAPRRSIWAVVAFPLTWAPVAAAAAPAAALIPRSSTESARWIATQEQ